MSPFSDVLMAFSTPINDPSVLHSEFRFLDPSLESRLETFDVGNSFTK